MRCPKCGANEDRVIDSRLAKGGSSIRRRRECTGCEHRYTTYEEIERADLRVAKRDGRSEAFDRHKLVGGMTKACEKRPVHAEALEQAADELTSELESLFPREIPSHAIGAKVMEKLRTVDQVAYVRYASVYRDFRDIGEFIDEIQSLERRMPASPAQPELFKVGP